jgi:hypothetical protein
MTDESGWSPEQIVSLIFVSLIVAVIIIAIPIVDPRWVYDSEISDEIEGYYNKGKIPNKLMNIAETGQWHDSWTLGGARISAKTGKMQIRFLRYRDSLFYEFGWDEVKNFDNYLVYLENIEQFQTEFYQWKHDKEVSLQLERERAKNHTGG